MSEGIVKWFDQKKGYGFIEKENGGELFVHYTSIQCDGFKTLSEGQRVCFEAFHGPKGWAASNVKVVQLNG
jgi:CspA family cold shock protein